MNTPDLSVRSSPCITDPVVFMPVSNWSKKSTKQSHLWPVIYNLKISVTKSSETGQFFVLYHRWDPFNRIKITIFLLAGQHRFHSFVVIPWCTHINSSGHSIVCQFLSVPDHRSSVAPSLTVPRLLVERHESQTVFQFAVEQRRSVLPTSLLSSPLVCLSSSWAWRGLPVCLYFWKLGKGHILY